MKSIKELMDLSHRVAVTTGGGGHIGSVMGEALAEAKANIVLVDNNEGACQDKAQNIQKLYGVKVLPLIVDLADQEAVQEIPARILKEFQSIDILIHSAAFTGRSQLTGWAVPFEEQTAETWRKTMEVNLTATFILTQSCSEALMASGHGSVINISSIYGMVGPDMSLYEGSPIEGHPAAYDAAKGALIQLTRYLATTLAPKVRVNSISVGGIFRGHKDPFLSKYEQKTPLKRMASEEDVKGAALYLASDLSRYVTGHNLVIDGGWTAW